MTITAQFSNKKLIEIPYPLMLRTFVTLLRTQPLILRSMVGYDVPDHITPYIGKNYSLPVIPEYVFLKDSFFQLMTRRVVLVTGYDITLNLYIEKCTFLNVSSSGNGGAIYYSNGGNCFMNGICGDSCYTQGTSDSFQFAYVVTVDGKTNGIQYATISRCPFIPNGRCYTLYLYYGIQTIEGLNISKSNLYTNCIQMTNGNKLNITFSSFVSNDMYNYLFYHNNANYQGNHYFQNNNWIGNKNSLGATSSVMFFTGVATNVFERNTFMQNQGIQFNVQTAASYGGVILVFCSIANPSFSLSTGTGKFLASTDIGGSFLMNTIAVTSGLITNTYALSHIVTAVCQADVPAYTPSSTNYSLSELCVPNPSPTECNIPSSQSQEVLHSMITIIRLTLLHALF